MSCFDSLMLLPKYCEGGQSYDWKAAKHSAAHAAQWNVWSLKDCLKKVFFIQSCFFLPFSWLWIIFKNGKLLSRWEFWEGFFPLCSMAEAAVKKCRACAQGARLLLYGLAFCICVSFASFSVRTCLSLHLWIWKFWFSSLSLSFLFLDKMNETREKLRFTLNEISNMHEIFSW